MKMIAEITPKVMGEMREFLKLLLGAFKCVPILTEEMQSMLFLDEVFASNDHSISTVDV